MPIRLLCVFLPILAAFSSCGGPGSDAEAVSSGIDDVFERVGTETDWDLSGNMIWGFYFQHHEKEPLEAFRDKLTALGYRFVSLEQKRAEAAPEAAKAAEKQEPPAPSSWWLHVEKVETHSASSMKKRSEELAAMAAESGIDAYDGMDVNPTLTSTVGHEHGWWVYLSDFEGSPGSISLNLALKPVAPFPKFEWLIITGIRFEPAKETKGLPDEKELAGIQQLRKKRISLIKQAVPAIEAGGLIIDGQEFHYIYVKNAEGIEAKLQQFYREQYPGREPLIKIEKNPDWSVFYETLFPSPSTIIKYEKELKAEGFWELVTVPKAGAGSGQ